MSAVRSAALSDPVANCKSFELANLLLLISHDICTKFARQASQHEHMLDRCSQSSLQQMPPRLLFS